MQETTSESRLTCNRARVTVVVVVVVIVIIPSSKGATTVLMLGGPSEAPKAKARAKVPKAPRRVGRGEGMSPSPLGDGSGEGAVPPPQKFFSIFYLKMVSFGAFWVVLPRCM